MRSPLIYVVSALVLLGCNAPPSRGGGNGGAGGGGGSPVTGGSGGSPVTGGSGGSVQPPPPDASTGGAGGAGGSGGSSPADGPAAPDVRAAADSAGGEAGGDPGGEPVEGRPWIRLCPKAWDQARCCMFLCECLNRLCTDSPMDKGRIPGCMDMCSKLTDFRARCQVFHCYESKNPGAVKDHESHCGHASGRVGGGSCTTITNQK